MFCYDLFYVIGFIHIGGFFATFCASVLYNTICITSNDIVVANFITNKGTFRVSFKKADKEYNEFKREKEAEKRRTAMATESAEDFSLAKKLKSATEDQEDDSKIHKYELIISTDSYCNTLKLSNS